MPISMDSVLVRQASVEPRTDSLPQAGQTSPSAGGSVDSGTSSRSAAPDRGPAECE